MPTPPPSIRDTYAVTEWINEYASKDKIHAYNRSQHGEVFTPLSTVREMLASVPRRFWRNPHIRLLDPAAGLGQFSTVAYQILMTSLSTWEPDATRRHEHIIRNIIHQVELNPKHAVSLRKIFGPQANIHRGDYLK